MKFTDSKIQFTDANIANSTCNFQFSALCTAPAFGDKVQTIEFNKKTVTIEKLGACTWYGKQGNNEFILIMSAQNQEIAGLAGKLNFDYKPSTGYPDGLSVMASIVFDLIQNKK